MPDEILVQVLQQVALADVASFVRLARVCKSLAFLVATEEQIWKRVCKGSEVGFGAMHYQWQREVLGGMLEDDVPILPAEFNEAVVDGQELVNAPVLSKEAVTEAVLPGYSSSWHQMFRLRPRIRFNGCYISTVK